jgi:hypothetical protein
MTSPRLIAALFAGSLALGFAAPAQACVDCFLKSKGVDGPVTDDLPKPPPKQLVTPGSGPRAPLRICSWQHCNLQDVGAGNPPASRPPSGRLALKKQFAVSPRR